MSARTHGAKRPVLLWIGPPLFAGVISMWSLRHAEPSIATDGKGAEETLPAGTSEIVGQLVGPSGAPAPNGITVHLVREEFLTQKSPASWRCCPSCPYELLDEQCDRAPQAIAQMIAFGMSEVVASRTSVTGSEGRFHFPMLPKGRYAVWSSAPRGTLALERNISLGDKERREIALESQFRSTLSGSVLSAADGHPIQGATVSALDVRIGTSFDAVTDESGSFRIGDLDRRETYYLLATSRGMAPQGKAGVTPGDDVVLELEDAASLAGTVLRDGLPAKGAKVDVDDLLRAAETDGDGHFRFDGLSPGIHVVRASQEDRYGRRLEFELSKGLSRNLTIELVRACNLKVTVLDSAGQPIAAADVRLLGKNSIDHRASKTDDNGTASFDLMTVGNYDLDAGRPDRGKVSAALRLTNDCTDVAQRLVIEDGPGVKGRVLDEADHPVAHADVNLEHVDASADEGEETTRTAKTDEEGKFRVPSLAPGTWQLTAAKEGYVDASDAFEMNKSDVELLLKLSKGGSIEGAVLDPSGRPAAGWLVSAVIPGFDPAGEESGPGNFSFGQRRYANADGTFVFSGLSQKDYEVYAEPPASEERGGAESSSARTEIVRAKSGDKKVIVRTKGSGELAGTVTFVGAPPPESFTVGAPGLGVKSFDGAAGRFHFAAAIAAAYPILIHAPGFTTVSARVNVPRGASAQVQVAMHASAHLKGRVVDARDGTPIAEATVASWAERKATENDDHPPASIAITRRDGHFELTDLAPGQHVLSAHAEGYARARLGPYLVTSSKEPAALEIRLERASVKLRGRILAGGRPLGQAFLSLRQPKDSERFQENVRTDAKGRFTFESVEPGLHALIIAARSRANAKETAIVRQLITVPTSGLDNHEIDIEDHGGDRRLVVELQGKRKGTLLVTLRPGTLEEKKIAELDVDRLDPGDARAVEIGQREIAFERVAPGAYTVSVSLMEPLDTSVLGYSMAHLKVAAVKHLRIEETERDARLTLLLE